METLNILFEIIVYSTVIYTATMLLKICFKNKMSPLLHYAIWFVLVLRLIMPVTIASPVRLFVIPAETHNAAAQQIQPQMYEPVSMPGISEAEPAESQLQTAAEVHVPEDKQTAPATFHRLNLPLPQIVTFVWLAGTGVCIWYLAVLYTSLRRKLLRNAAQPSKALIALFNEVKAEMGIKANIKLVCLYEYGTPSLMFPRTIIMPVDTLVAMNEEQTKFALRHELMHYRRGDHIISILLSLLNAVYWFNPFVWAALRQMRADMETACDGAVVKALTASARSRYASLILNLSARPAHRQLALGMSDSNAKKAAERRVKGIYMKGKSKMSVKLITVLLAVTLIFTCFTTACQPVTENTAAVNINQDMLEENINQETSADLTSDIPEHINEEITGEGNYPIVINADVENLTLDAYPVYSIVPCNFTQSEVDTIVKYFFNDSPLFAPDYIKSKSMIEAELAQFRADLQKMDGSNPDDIEGCQAAIKKLEELYPTAPDTEIRTQITSKLTVPPDVNYEILDATADLGYTERSSVWVSNSPGPLFPFMNVIVDRSRCYLSSSLLAGKNPEGQSMTPNEAIQKAEDALEQMGIEDMMVVKVEAGMTEDQSKQGYVVTFRRNINGVPVVHHERIDNSEGRPDLAAKWQGDELQICLDDEGISYFDWFHKGKVQEELTANAQLRSFDEIMDIARQELKNKFAGSFKTVNVDSIVLEYTCAPQKDNPGSYLIVPAWNFYKNTAEEAILQNYYCVLSINAVDGSVIY